MSTSKILLWSAVVLRIIVSAFFYHPDIKSQHFHASFLSEGVINIYEYLAENKSKLPYTDTFNYPPLTYLSLGIWQQIATVLAGPGLKTWLWDWSENAIKTSTIFSYLLILKLPYICMDFLVLLFARHLIKNPISRTRFQYLWLFNPFSLYIIYMVGQFDIIPVLLSVISLILFKKSKYLLAGLMLGLGIALKTYPIVVVPFFLIHLPLKKSINFCLGVAIGWLASNIGFIFSPAYQDSVLKSSLASRIFSFKLGNIPVFIPYYLGLLFIARKRSEPNIIADIFIVTAAVVVFTKFHAQWLLWSLPFGLLMAAENKILKYVILCFYSLAFIWIFLLSDQYVLIGLFTPLNPYLATIPPLVSLAKIPPILSEYIQYALILICTGVYFLSFKNGKKQLWA